MLTEKTGSRKSSPGKAKNNLLLNLLKYLQTAPCTEKRRVQFLAFGLFKAGVLGYTVKKIKNTQTYF